MACMSELHKLSGSICSMVISNTALQDEKGSRSLSPKFQKKRQAGLPWWFIGGEFACQGRRRDPWSGRIPLAKE